MTPLYIIPIIIFALIIRWSLSPTKEETPPVPEKHLHQWTISQQHECLQCTICGLKAQE